MFKDVDPSIVDNLTFKYTFDETRNETSLIDKVDGTPVYWIMLDCSVDKINERIKSRNMRDIWETQKSLFYYRNRYLELAAYLGIPVIDTCNLSLDQVVENVLKMHTNSHFYREVRDLALKNITFENIKERDIEHVLFSSLKDKCHVGDSVDSCYVGGNNSVDLLFRQCESQIHEECAFLRANSEDAFMSDTFKLKIYTRWLCKGKISLISPNQISIKVPLIPISPNSEGEERFTCTNLMTTFVHLIDEGESKKIYRFITNNPYLQRYTIIVLKSTIYSHSMQATGEIKDLCKIRATGTQVFLEMMNRNNLCHTYQSINNSGIIFSRFLETVPPTEIVVKKYCEGTDKHSYYGMAGSDFVLATGEYKTGPYVRFDWRNPNHISVSSGVSVSQNSYYYICEETIGKERFFELFLKHGNNIKPFGDRSISEDLIVDTINTNETKKSVLKMFMTIQYYFKKIGLEIKDVCFMLDKTGQIFWSEINQDCMRIKTTDKFFEHALLGGVGGVGGTTSFDKDIWRAGGSSSKDTLVKKWIQFNKIMVDFFNLNPFQQTEIFNYGSYPFHEEVYSILSDKRLQISSSYVALYKSMIPKRRRRVIVTMDLHDGEPVLVKSGQVYTTHSNASYLKAMEKISIFPDILVVDLNGALTFDDTQTRKESPNRKIVKELAQKYYIHSGGGLRTLEDVQDVLESSARRIVISSASIQMDSHISVQDNLLTKIPRERLIVELSVNEKNEILIHGRKTNTGIPICDKLCELADVGVEAISITFHCTEGHMKGLPREQIRDLMLKIPRRISKVIIAGGVSTLDDLRFLWSFDNVIPQLGSAIWTNTLSVGDVYNEMINYDNEGKIPAIVQDVHGRVKGQIYVNSEAIKKMTEERMLYRYSRESRTVTQKGATSGNVQYVSKLSLDCDSDSILITVDTTSPFCHTGNYSCFSLQTVVKANINTLTDHIKEKMSSNSYSGVMQQNPGLALSKLMEEFWEIVTAYDDTQINECSDLLVHLLMYMNGKGISINDILNELNARRWNPHLLSSVNSITNTAKIDADKEIVVAVTAAKYSNKTDKYAEEHLGFKIIRTSEKSRSLKVEYEIVDSEKFTQFCGTKSLSIITSRPKDMPWLLAAGRITHIITYETVVKNFPKVYSTVHEVVDPDIGLALICRNSDNINVNEWSSENKVLVAAEHVWHVSDFFHKEGVQQNVYHLDRIMGSSEGFLINTTKYLLCDAVVESGKTLEDNDLKVWKYIIPKGQVKMGLYSGLRS
jgi:phosphoribosyl-ATP pyrophosphohydrolase